MTRRFQTAMFALGIALLAWFAWPDAEQRAVQVPPAEVLHAEAKVQEPPSRSSTQFLFGQSSPFGRGAPPEAPKRNETLATLREAFRQSGLRTPERYYHLGFKELRALARSGDIYANLQLGMQYTFTNNALEFDPDYDFHVNPKAEAFKLFNSAALMGSTSAMVMISTKLADTSPVEAYAWKILSDQLTSESQLEFYRGAKYDFRLSSDDAKKASIISEEMRRMMLSNPRIPPPSE